MFVRSLSDVEQSPFHVDWGNGTSHRLLTKGDGFGFTICHTIVRAGTTSRLQYRNHLEACYCIAGSGEIEDMVGNVYPIRVGDMYALNQHDEHYLRSSPDVDMVLVSVFNPPLRGDEQHSWHDSVGSSY